MNLLLGCAVEVYCKIVDNNSFRVVDSLLSNDFKLLIYVILAFVRAMEQYTTRKKENYFGLNESLK